MTKLLISFFILTISAVACKPAKTSKQQPLGDMIAFQETGLKGTVDILLEQFSKHRHGRNSILIEGKSSMFNIDSISLLLRQLREIDVFDDKSFGVYRQKCNGIETMTWKTKARQVDTIRLKKHLYQSLNNEEGSNNDIKITDFEIYTTNGKRALMLRVVNDIEFEQLSVGTTDYKLNYYDKIINGTVYKPVFESRLLGLDEVEKEYEIKKKVCW